MKYELENRHFVAKGTVNGTGSYHVTLFVLIYRRHKQKYYIMINNMSLLLYSIPCGGGVTYFPTLLVVVVGNKQNCGSVQRNRATHNNGPLPFESKSTQLSRERQTGLVALPVLPMTTLIDP